MGTISQIRATVDVCFGEAEDTCMFAYGWPVRSSNGKPLEFCLYCVYVCVLLGFRIYFISCVVLYGIKNKQCRLSALSEWQWSGLSRWGWGKWGIGCRESPTKSEKGIWAEGKWSTGKWENGETGNWGKRGKGEMWNWGKKGERGQGERCNGKRGCLCPCPLTFPCALSPFPIPPRPVPSFRLPPFPVPLSPLPFPAPPRSMPPPSRLHLHRSFPAPTAPPPPARRLLGSMREMAS